MSEERKLHPALKEEHAFTVEKDGQNISVGR